MEQTVTLCRFGSLRDGSADPTGSVVRIALSGPAALREILRLAGIPLEQVQLVMLNHRSVPGDTVVHPGDRLAVFPREYPIFADWRDHRFC